MYKRISFSRFEEDYMQRGTSREWGGMQGWSVGEPDVPNEFAFLFSLAVIDAGKICLYG